MLVTVARPARAAARTAAAPALAGRTVGCRQFTIYNQMYKTIFKSNISYITYILVGAITLEYAYSTAIDTAWNSYNRGKLFSDIDWSKWKFHLDEEEEEEEEEAAEEEAPAEGEEGSEESSE